jgi:hypothetical protein
VTPESTGPISRLAYATTEADAMALITEAVLRGASPDDCHDAMRIWQRIHREDVIRLEATL